MTIHTSQSKSPLFQPLAWLALPLLQVVLLLFFATPPDKMEWLVLTSFVAITGFSSWRLFAERRPYSLNKIWWIFNAVFLGFIPSIQAALYHTPWYQHDISHTIMLHTNLLILGCLLLYLFAHYLFSKKINVFPIPESVPDGRFVSRFTIVAPILMTICGIVLLIVYGWRGLFLRGYLEAISHNYDSSFQLFFDKGVRGIVLYISLATILLFRQGKLGISFTLLILLVAFILNFPLAIPRYLAFTIYLAWLLAAQWDWVQRGKLFVVTILSVLLLAGPIIGVTRYAGIDMGERIKHPTNIFEQAYLTSDYDAYSSLCRTIYYVDTAGSTHGRQLAGVALFFVPRKVWPEKPVGSGAHLFTQLNFDFKNVSCTWLAEGYINFGIGGSILFTIIIALIISCYDKAFWQYKFRQNLHYLSLFYFVFMGMLMFILRGDLLSSFAYTCGLFVSGWLLHRGLKIGKVK